MFEQVFKYHYSNKFAYALDALCIAIGLEFILFLNGSVLIIRSLSDKLLFIALALCCITLFRGYTMLLRFTTFIDIGKIALGLLLSLAIYATYIKADTRGHYNYLLLLFYFCLSLLAFYRLIIRLLYARATKEDKLINTLLFGAGPNGLRTKRALDDSNAVNVIGFIDDDPAKIGRSIEGLSVVSLGQKLEKLIENKKVQQIIITSSEVTQKEKNELFQFFKAKGVRIFTVPPLDDLASSKGIVGNLTPVKIEDLLKRDQINIDQEKNKIQYRNKTILVTGAAGSIGSEIVRQLIQFEPKEIILYDQAETPLFDLKNELVKQKCSVIFHYYLQDITDKAALEQCFDVFSIDVVFHAAAYKHVFMTEAIPKAAIINNILGTKNVVDVATKNKVNHLVMVSTDKAVNPSNVMGASKRIAEMYVAGIAEGTTTKIITTRFGNVLGSNGSVVPIFKEQIAKGGPVTVTHPEITRYFMTITEACQLVLEAGASGDGGEIFVFDMGEPVKIVDLAISMIRLSGLIEGQDIELVYTGLRPGEKLYEELLTDKESLKPSHNELIFIAEKEHFSVQQEQAIQALIDAALQGATAQELVKQMKAIVPEFISMNSSYTSLDKIN
ncbi:polysaccharide biosynthesis protein [Flavobacteriaceae bacterium]|nr:polysaccharide biosynthesis protein [Flavobacteriaceae bacterium]